MNSAARNRAAIVLSDEALAIHRRSLLIDGHNDLPWEMREKHRSSFESTDIRNDQPSLNTDIPRLRQGNVGAQFWSAYVPSDTLRTGGAVRQTLEQIDLIHQMLDRYPDVFELASTAADIERIHRAGKIASMIGIEGGHCIDNSLAVLRDYYRLGARYMTLTHSDSLDWADSATDDSRSGGLSLFGIEVIREMNRLGMLVDLSHVAPATMHAALRASKAPVIFSHSSAYSVASHPRNVPDDVLQLMPRNGGVVMVNFFSGFVVPQAAQIMTEMFTVGRKLRAQFTDDAQFKQAIRKWYAEHPIEAGTIHDVVDHIDHIVKVAGIDHVGLGSDFDGVTQLPRQLEDVSCYPLITQELINRHYSAEQIDKILGQNILRALRQAEQVAGELQQTRQAAP
jgi:membrane dipeptidase